MTTTATSPVRAQVRRAKPVWDRLFFGGMAILLAASVVLGFARSYFLAGVFRAPLPSRMIHIHGAVFSLWFLVLLIQTFLIPAGRVQWHRQIGLASYGVAILVVVFGVLAATDSLRRGVPIGSYNVSVSFAVSMMDMVAFAVVILCSYLTRRRPDAHKRLVLFATLSIMDAALDRWPYEALGLSYSAHVWAYLGLLLLPVIYDLIVIRRIHRSTLWSVIFVYALNQLRVPIGETHLWTAFSRIVAGHPLR